MATISLSLALANCSAGSLSTTLCNASPDSRLEPYRLFISHTWTYTDEYCRLADMLNDAPHFDWANNSDPERDELKSASRDELLKTLREQIRPVDAVLVLSDMYAAHSDWIEAEAEVEFAQDYMKPIIGIYPWGYERAPRCIERAAAVMVRWPDDLHSPGD